MTKLERIRQIYKNNDEPFGALWEWAREGNTKRERYKRFAALARWAGNHASNTRGETKEKWEARAKIYRRRKRQILTRIKEGGTTKLGEGSYSGSASFIDIIIMPIYSRYGIPPTSRKRWETFGNPSSDHYAGNYSADALDGGIANAQWLHAKIRDEFRRKGVPLSPDPADYRMCYCTANGARFRFQGIAATHGTGPHYHAGVRRV